MATHSFPVPIHSSKNNKTRSQTQANILICLLDHLYMRHQLQIQKWNAKGGHEQNCLSFWEGLEPSMLQWKLNYCAQIVEYI